MKLSSDFPFSLTGLAMAYYLHSQINSLKDLFTERVFVGGEVHH